VTLVEAYLGRTNLTSADLTDAILTRAEISSANFLNAILTGTTMPDGSIHT